MQEIRKIYLKKDKESSLKRFHPWVFSGAIKSLPENIAEGELLEVYSHTNEFLGIGHYEPTSIAVRLFSFTKITPDYAFWKSKIEKAYNYRKNLGFMDNPNTNIYRLLYAEGDGVPGLIIDIYNKTAVLQAHTIGIYQTIEVIAKALKDVYQDRLEIIYDKSGKTIPQNAATKAVDRYLLREVEMKENVSTENGNDFYINWEDGQKTGFFIDQRDNRALLGKYSKGKSVLNTFCYTGGFSVYAANAGAKEVHSVDSSKRAIEMTDRNIILNNQQENHKSFAVDTFDFLKNNDNKYDVIILDPPAFAKHLNAKHNAIMGYKRLNQMAMSKIKKGGILFTFSCSQVVDKYTFNSTIMSSAIEAGREVKIVSHLSHPEDHPVNIFHPEGEYLKGLVLYVD